MSLELKTKNNHDECKGIYAESVKASRKDIPLAREMALYCDEQAENWEKEYGLRAWAMAHCQLTDSETPKRIFVVHPDLVKESEPTKNTRFPNRAVFNPRIVQWQTGYKKKKKVRKTVPNKRTGKREIKNVWETYEIPNLMRVDEGCMSFPHRKPKKVDRVFKIKVFYWYPRKVFGLWVLWPKLEWVEGLKAQVFQHEIQHFEGDNIYFPKQKDNEPERT